MRTLLASLRANALVIVTAIVLTALNYHWWTLLAKQSPSGQARQVEKAIVGTVASPVVAQATSGEWARLELAEPERNVLLYVTSPSCGWCARNMANIKALATAIAGRYDVIVLIGEPADAREYASANDLQLPVYSSVSAGTKEAYRMIGTPQTIVIKNGVIVGNWIGAYSGSKEDEIEKFFDVELPGLLPEELPASTGLTAPPSKRVGCTDATGGFYSPGAAVSFATGRKRCDPSGRWIDQP